MNMTRHVASAGLQFLHSYGGMKTPRKSGQLVSIQYLRAVAAIMVVAVHLVGQLRRLGYVGPWPEWMTAGVDIFFVISGFVMWLTTRTRPCGTMAFYLNRLIRIVPLYWLLTSLITGLMIVIPSIVLSGEYDTHHVIMSYLFLPAVAPVSDLVQPVLEPGWTLNYEMYFYAVFGALLFLPERLSLLAVSAWLVASTYAGTMNPTSNLLIQFYGSSIVLDFGFGVLLGAAFMRGWVLPAPLAWMSLGLGFGKLAAPGFINGPHWLVIGLPALAIVAGAVAIERRRGIRRMGALLLVGDASYSIYLSHGIILSACFQITKKLGVDGGLFMMPVFSVASCLAVAITGITMHFAVEKPLTKFCSAACVWMSLRMQNAQCGVWIKSILRRGRRGPAYPQAVSLSVTPSPYGDVTPELPGQPADRRPAS